MSDNQTFKNESSSRRVLLAIAVVVIVGSGIIWLFKASSSADTAASKSKVNSSPDVQSLPGVNTASEEYVKARELANQELAKQASETLTESAVPTITRTILKDIQENDSGKAGCDIESLRRAREAGVTASELRCRGCSAAQLRQAGYTAAELKAAGYSASELRAAGYSAAELRAAGYSAAELREAGFSADELKAAGFSAAELRDAGFSAQELLNAGFSAQDLFDAGYSLEELKLAGVSGSDLDSIKQSCDIEQLKKDRAAGVSAESLKDKGCSLAALKAAGFTAAELKAAGFSASELRDAGFSAEELKAAGFSAAELKTAGFSAAELRAAGFSAAELKEAGFSAADLRAAGFSAGDLMNAGYSLDELRDAGFSEGELIRAGFASSSMSMVCDVEHIAQARKEGVDASYFRDKGCSALALAAAGYTEEELRLAGYSDDELSAIAMFNKKDRLPGVDSRVQMDLSGPVDPYDRLKLDQKNMEDLLAQSQAVQEAETTMMGYASQLISTWAPMATQVFVEKEATEEVPSNNASPVDNLPPSKIFTAKAGDVMYAVLTTEVDTDVPGPIMATLVSGKLKGARLIGSFTQAGESAQISFNSISLPKLSRSSGIQAIAVDADTAKTALASEVDHHYLLRYGSLFASSFLKGFSNAITNEGSTVTNGDSTVQTISKKSNNERVMIGLGEVGTEYAKSMSSNFERPITVKVKKGTGFGLLFVSDTKIPLVDI